MLIIVAKSSVERCKKAASAAPSGSAAMSTGWQFPRGLPKFFLTCCYSYVRSATTSAVCSPSLACSPPSILLQRCVSKPSRDQGQVARTDDRRGWSAADTRRRGSRRPLTSGAPECGDIFTILRVIQCCSVWRSGGFDKALRFSRHGMMTNTCPNVSAARSSNNL